MDLIVTDTNDTELAALADCTLDMAFGAGDDGENNFILEYPEEPRLGKGSLVYVDGTEYGGMVSGVKASTCGDTTALTYTGPTWHGLLAQRVLCPDLGADWLTVSGEANHVLGMLLARIGLTQLMTAEPKDSGLSITGYRFDRYTDAYAGIRSMLATCGAKLHIARHDGTTWLSARPITDYTDVVDSDRINFDSTREWRRVNHLIGLGEGELRNRARSDWYADADGNVSQTQTLKGIDEVAATYDYSNAKPDELAKDTCTKLKELQGQGEVKVTVRDGGSYDVGDLLLGRDNSTGLTVHATIAKKIIKIDHGIPSVEYEAGETGKQESGLSGSAESSPGEGRTYLAGKGLTLTGATFSAQVTPETLKPIADQAAEAMRTASGFSEQIGEAQAAARANVGTVSALAPLLASRTGAAVNLSVAVATPTAPGVMVGADKAKLDGIAPNANDYHLSRATTERIGGVRPDGTSVTIDSAGVISAHAPASNLDATHPVGGVVRNTTGVDPASDYGGVWRRLPSLNEFTYERIS